MKTRIPFELIDIQGDGLHIQFKAKIGRKRVHLLIDTGASRTVFDHARLKNIYSELTYTPLDRLSAGLGTRTLEGSVVELPSLKLGDLTIKAYTVAVLDLSHVNESYRSMGLLEIDGVLGSDLLLNYNALIDYKKRIMTLST